MSSEDERCIGKAPYVGTCHDSFTDTCFIGCVNETLWDYAEGEVFEDIGEDLDQECAI